MINRHHPINSLILATLLLLGAASALLWGPFQVAPAARANQCEQHDFGTPGVQYYVYSDGRTWNFTATSSMTVTNLNVTSVLASNFGVFNIQIKINGTVVDSWTHTVVSTLYQPYTHSSTISTTLNAGDTITYFIYGGTLSTPVGGIMGVNSVQLCDSGQTDFYVIDNNPASNSLAVASKSVILATFNQSVDFSTVSARTFTVHGSQTGVYEGVYSEGSVVFDATQDFRAGEKIQVNLSSGIKSITGTTLVPYAFEFYTAVAHKGGTFVEIEQSMSSSGSEGVALGDLDGDGDLDAFVANGGLSPGGDKVWFNNGSGSFVDSGQILGSGYGRAVELGDVDGDGDLDAFVVNGNNSTNLLWLNDGTGHFSNSGLTLGNSSSWGVDLGDVDGDGDLDAFVANSNQPDYVWLNDGSGNFTNSNQSLGNSASHDVDLGDVDGDGDLDAFVANDQLQSNQLWLNDGAGNFTDSNQLLGNSSSWGVVLADLDGDSDLDAFVANYDSPSKVWQNNGSGNFTDSGQVLGTVRGRGIALGDLNGDGALDAIIGSEHGDATNIWFNNGNGVFSLSSQSLGVVEVLGLDVGDIDNDGSLDVFLVGNGSPNKVWLNQDSASCIVTTTADSGGGSLRQCMLDAQPGDTIAFDTSVFPTASPATISLNSALPEIITDSLTIDGSNAGVILDGSALSSGTGLTINGPGNVTVKGLQILNFPDYGLHIGFGSAGNVIGGSNPGPGCAGDCNLISGNGNQGIRVDGNNNTVAGNFVGVNAAGTGSIPNGRAGIAVYGYSNDIGAGNDSPGGNCTGGCNLISGNGDAGIGIGSLSGADTDVLGNYIGVDVTGTKPITNSDPDIEIDTGGSGNRIGDRTASGRNVLGTIFIEDAGSDNNHLWGNYIGVNAAGTAALGSGAGVTVSAGSRDNEIGGSDAGEGNLISGSTGNGITIRGSNTLDNAVEGNKIGVNAAGAPVLGNTGNGISLEDGAAATFIGGSTPEEQNLIAGNHAAGIRVTGPASVQNTISQNSIYNNTALGISLENGGNNNLSAPTVTAFDISAGTVSGTACANCTIEIFSDDEDEGRIYEGTTTANSSGGWTFNKGSALTGPNVTATATDGNGNTSEFGGKLDQVFVYLPVVLINAGPPAAPTLNSIDNADGDSSYTVSWNAVSGASSYTLEEDDNALFSSPVTVYAGAGTSKSIVGKNIGTYYYRVKASNTFGSSSWSNARSVVVTVPPPPCPQTGSWSGTTNQGYPIAFTVSTANGCQLSVLSIKYATNCAISITTIGPVSILNNHFNTGGSAPKVIGDFNSQTSASGTWSYSGTLPFPPYSSCVGSGTWSASYTP